MQRIVGIITSLDQHAVAVRQQAQDYRPTCCVHCGRGSLWGHGCYYRKADRSPAGALNPVAVPRFLCPGCNRTCSRLPACVAPRRWFNWAVQQVVLLLLLGGMSLHACSLCSGRPRRTVGRWWAWLRQRHAQFSFVLRSRRPDWGRQDDMAAFWRHVIDEVSLTQAMVMLDHELTVP